MHTHTPSIEAIKEMARPLGSIQDVDGVYFLLRKGEIVMAGMSTECQTRVSFHAKDKSKSFDAYTILLRDNTDEQPLEDYLASVIIEAQPEYNSRLHRNSLFGTAKDVKGVFGVDKVKLNAMIRSGQTKAYPLHGQVYYSLHEVYQTLFPNKEANE